MKQDIIHRILEIDESFKAPGRLMEILFDRDKRESVFRQFLDHESDLSYEWFSDYFEEEQADRKTKKQDFTPQSVSELLNALVGNESKSYYEVAAGTGSLLIQAWDRHRTHANMFTYYPSQYWYHVEELSDRALPFLLFNYLIRGMNGVVVHGDALTREIKNIYFMQNSKDDFMGFSDLNVMPRNGYTEREFNVKKWLGEPIHHIESELLDIVEPS